MYRHRETYETYEDDGKLDLRKAQVMEGRVNNLHLCNHYHYPQRTQKVSKFMWLFVVIYTYV